ncbi:hypothetical protein CSA56_06600 [candidate division KSB3 bacterium]|uniref:DUF218 domain-containing protein n=1 Tax=candidate division KSB3 bacterium TaxID=2044937 RepID=A0A2G6KGQ0_9BACT|nr:MAG: hypothetical protein CSA56_06600 [candidate division KSB3 bacterium]
MIKRSIVLLGVGSLVFAGILGAMNLYILKCSESRIYEQSSQAPKAYTALILGAKAYAGGRLSHMLEDRVLTGLELYRQGKVQKLLLSGDHGRKDYDEVNAMRNYLLEKGVPAQDIFMDHAGFNTYSSMYRARDVFQVHDVIIVTQKFHVTRAVYIARSLGLDAVGMIADRRIYMTACQVKSDIREVLARVKAFVDVIRRAKPKYSGSVIPITGDGRHTLG